MKLATRATALGFAIGSLAHTAGFLLLLRGITLYGPGYPAWRHVVMATVDAAIAWLALRGHRAILVALPAFVLEQLIVNGVGWEPMVVAIAWGAILTERRWTRSKN